MTDLDQLVRIGERIVDLREASGLSQEKLAQVADVSIATVFKLEQNDRWDVKISTVYKIASALGTSIDYLATGKSCAFNGDKDATFAGEMVRRYGFESAKAAYILQRLEGSQFSEGDTPDTIAAAIKMAERDYEIANGAHLPPSRPPEVIQMRPGMKRRKAKKHRR